MSLQNQQILQQAADQARGLAIDAVHACSSGHLGLPLGAAEVGAVLYGHDLQVDPSDANWLNRDRFVLSAGHGSMFLYGWLHLSGFNDLNEEDRLVMKKEEQVCMSLLEKNSRVPLFKYIIDV